MGYKMSSENGELNTSVTCETEKRTTGRVKWFNNKQGYGFVTVGSGSHSGEDVFVHHTALKTGEEQYRYLVQGEYIEFDWTKAEAGDHEWQAIEVTGLSGGKLMCETRNESRLANSSRNTQQDDEGEMRPPRPRRRTSSGPPHRIRGGGPRDHDNDEDVEWKLVPVRRNRGNGGGNGGRRQSRPRGDDHA